MKKLLKLCFIALLFFSCSNEEFSDNVNPSDLILKEVTSVTDSPDYYQKFHFNEEGQPLLWEEYESDFNSDIRSYHQVYYNANNTIDSLFLGNPVETGFIKFEYDNDIMTYFRHGTPAPSKRFFVEHNNNSIVMTSDVIPFIHTTGEYIFTFNNDNYELLTQVDIIGTPPNSTSPSSMQKTNLFYDINNNLEREIKKNFNEETMSFEIIYEINYIYDGNINPFKNTILNSPIIRLMRNDIMNLPSFIFWWNEVSSNNVISKTTTHHPSNTTSTINYQYEYNQLNYPISMIATRMFSNDETSTTTKTYTYY